MNLLVDIGNSRIKWALEQNGVLANITAVSRVADNVAGVLKRDWQLLGRPEQVWVANVAGTQAAAMVTSITAQLWAIKPVFARVQTSRCGLVNAYEDVQQLGIDRWLAMLAAWSLYRKPLCVASVGTALTIDAINAEGRHLGGYIIPGPVLMQELLIKNTNGISVPVTKRYGLGYGRNTLDCVRNGAALATVASINRIAADMQQEYEALQCVITGGGAQQLMELLTCSVDYQPQLVLKGLMLLGGDK